MDLNTLKLSTSTTVEILHPETLEPLGIQITLASPDSEKVKVIKREGVNKRLQVLASGRKQKSAGITAEDLESERLDVLVAATLGWSGIEINGPFECTPQNARKLYSDPAYAWITKQVDEAFGDQVNFFQK